MCVYVCIYQCTYVREYVHINDFRQCAHSCRRNGPRTGTVTILALKDALTATSLPAITLTGYSSGFTLNLHKAVRPSRDK